MSNSTSPSTSADLAQGHVSKKSAGAEAPVSGLAKGSSFIKYNSLVSFHYIHYHMLDIITIPKSMYILYRIKGQ